MSEALHTSGDASAHTPHGMRELLVRFAPLAPFAIGIACARAGMSVATAGGFKSTDDGIFSDGSLAVALLFLVIAGAVLFKTEKTFSKRTVRRINHIAAFTQVAALLVMGVLCFTGQCTFPVRFTLSVIVVLATLAAIGCWLRAMRGAGMMPAAVMVFAGVFLSEIPVFATAPLSDGARCLAVAPVVACQALCIAWAHRRKADPSSIEAPVRSDDYLIFMGGGAVTRQFLLASAIGIAAISLVVGFLRGFPNGDPVPFCEPTRIATFVLTEVACLWFIASTLRQKARTMTVTIWVLMELLAAMTLVLYTAFPDHLDIGAVSITLLGSIMTAFLWYVIISFMSTGWREPFYYAICILAIWVLSRAIGRFVLIGVMPIGGDQHFTGSVISLLLLISTQLVLVKLIDVAQFAAHRNIAAGYAVDTAGFAAYAGMDATQVGSAQAGLSQDNAAAQKNVLQRNGGMGQDAAAAVASASGTGAGVVSDNAAAVGGGPSANAGSTTEGASPANGGTFTDSAAPGNGSSIANSLASAGGRPVADGATPGNSNSTFNSSTPAGSKPIADGRATGSLANADAPDFSHAGRTGAASAPSRPPIEIEATEADSTAAFRHPAALEKLLGIDDHSSVAAVQKAAMQHRAEAMGRQFLLSEREIEVLALYASGLTQKRVAESLHISQTTAHTHIGRIYVKTGLHSRQELIDYLHQYAEA